MNVKRILLLIVVTLSTFILSSCWDSIELEKRAFDIGIAIDLEGEQKKKNPTFRLTAQLVVPSGVGTPSATGSSGQTAFRNISTTGESLHYSYKQLSKVANRTLASQHLQVIVVSEKVIEQKDILNRIIDVFVRGHDMQRGMDFVVAKNNAAELLTIEPQHTNIPSLYISTLLEYDKSGEAIKHLTIGNLQEYLAGDKSFVAPYLSMFQEQKSVIDGGAAVYNSYEKKMVGTLTSEETKGLNIFTGDLISGPIEIQFEDNIMVLELSKVKSSPKLVNEDVSNLEFIIDIKANAEISESYAKNTPFDINVLQPIIEEEVRKIVEKTINKAQKELKTDILKLGSYLEGKHYKLWKEIKDNWEQGEHYFSNSKLTLNINIVMSGEGSTIDAKEEGN